MSPLKRRSAWKYGIEFSQRRVVDGMGLVLYEDPATLDDEDAPYVDGYDVELRAARGELNLRTWLDD